MTDLKENSRRRYEGRTESGLLLHRSEVGNEEMKEGLTINYYANGFKLGWTGHDW